MAETDSQLQEETPSIDTPPSRAMKTEEPLSVLSEDNANLHSEEINNPFETEASLSTPYKKTGIEALIDKALLTYERLPMLEIVFDRFVRMMSTTLRNFTSENIDVDIHSITSIHFGDYINSIPAPAMLAVFKANEWENLGLMNFDSSLVYSLVDVLFGGRRSNLPVHIEGRPYTTIEQTVIKQVSNIMLIDLGLAFDPLSPTTLQFERLEINPRFATIARPADAAILLQLRIDMEEKGGNIEILLPYVTLDPIRELLTQVFMGEKFGKDTLWENHFGKEIARTTVELEALLATKTVSLGDIAHLQIGSTIIMDTTLDDDIILHSQGVKLLAGRLGRVENNLAVEVSKALNKKLKGIFDVNP